MNRQRLLPVVLVLLQGMALVGAAGRVAHAAERTGPDLSALDGTLPATRDADVVPALRIETAQVSARWEGEFLHVGIRSAPIFVANLCLAHDDKVQVLHASAALGSVEYIRGESAWTLHGSFDWQLRDTTQDDAAIAERQRYLDLNGWVGTTVPMGEPGQTEFVIAARLVPPGTRFTVSLMPASDPESIVEFVADAVGCNDHRLVAGPPPDALRFAPETWAEVPGRKRSDD